MLGIVENHEGVHMKTSGSSRSEARIGNTLGECIGANLAVIISLILLVGSMKLVGMLALGPIGAFWFGAFVTILIIGLVAWTAFFLLFIAHFATLSRFM
jgi:hypothetical protein